MTDLLDRVIKTQYERKIEMKRLNLYIPKNQKPTNKFLRNLKKALPSDVEIVQVEHEIPSICEVGFDIPPYAKLQITQDLIASLHDCNFFRRVWKAIAVWKR